MRITMGECCTKVKSFSKAASAWQRPADAKDRRKTALAVSE